MLDYDTKNRLTKFLKKNKIIVRDSWKGQFKNGISVTIPDTRNAKKFIDILKSYNNHER